MKTIIAIDKEIEKLQEQKNELLALEQKKQTFLIEGYEVTKPVKAETYDKAKLLCPKGFRLPKRWELFKILEDMENRNKLTDKYWMFFWTSTIEDNYVKGLYLYRDLDFSSRNEGLSYSSEDGRVAFVRNVSNQKPKRKMK